MKKILISMICLMGAAFCSQAQEIFDLSRSGRTITLGARAGLNLSTISDMEADYRAGFHVGLAADFKIVNSLYVNTGLYFSMKGANCDLGDISTEYGRMNMEVRMNPMYLEIPVMASYRYNFGRDIQWQLNFGPWLAFGVAGDVTAEASVSGASAEESVNFFDAGGNHFDMGLALGTGLTYRQFYVGLNYQFGLTHAVSTDVGNPNTSNVSLSLGYNFYSR